MKKPIIITIVIAAIIAIAAPLLFAGVNAERRASDLGPAGGLLLERVHRIAGELDLTDEQVIELRHIGKAVRQQNAAYRAEMRQNFRQAAAVLIANPDDTVRAKQILQQSAASEQELRANILEGVSKALNVLTPEQRTKLGTMLEKRMAV